MSRTRVGIVGAGAVGRYVAGFLGAEADVVLVGRERQRASIETDGITVVPLVGRKKTVRASTLEFATEPRALRGCDVVLIAVKSGQSAETARSLAPILEGDPLVVSLQNGVRNAEVLREHFERVAAAIVSFNVVAEDGGVVRQTTDGPLMIEGINDRARELATTLASAGVPSKAMRDIVPSQWTKLLINLSNSISALSGVPTRELLMSAGYRRIMAAVLEEALGVLGAAGIKAATLRGVPLSLMVRVLRLPTPLARLVLRARMKIDPRARSSMWQDLELRRATEIDYLNGEIVRLAKDNDREAPRNARLVALIRAAEEKGQGSPELSADELARELGL